MASSRVAALWRGAALVCESCLIRPLPPSNARPLSLRFVTAASSTKPSTQFSSQSRPQTTSARSTPIPRPSSTLPVCRPYSTSSQLPEAASAGLAPVASRRLIKLSGPEAAKFLHGLTTNNVSLDRNTPFYAAFLDARGRVLWDVFVWVYPELVTQEGHWACYIEVDAGEIDTLLQHLRRHRLRSKFSIDAVEQAELGVWAAWGAAAEQWQGKELVASLVDPRGADFGLRYLVKGNQQSENAPVPVVDTLQYHLRRYLFGIPEGQQEMQRANALPMESNIELSQGIDFKKGCYIGQELTIRTKHTGVVRKRILPVQLYTSEEEAPSSDEPVFDPSSASSSDVETGADIKQLDEGGGMKNGRAAGKWIAGIGNVGLALCRLEMMTSMRISAEGGTWKPGMEFGVQKRDGQVVKIKAVVPPWFRERERDVWDKNRTRT